MSCVAREVVIAGGGIVGATLALALARAGVSVCVVDAEAGAAAADPRASVVAASAVRMWEALGLSPDALADAQPITRLQVGDGPSPSASAPRWGLAAALSFDADDSGEPGPLGWMIPNGPLRASLRDVATTAGVHWIAGARLTGLEAAAGRAEARLDDGRRLSAGLAVGAEGRRSAVREAAGIGVSGWNYRQEGVVATVRLGRPHGSVARQLFLPTGPLAVLPLTADELGDRASLVWSTSPTQARALVESSAAAFEAMLSRVLGEGAELLGGRARFPLELRLAQAMVAPRVALAGDAAQVIHPVAGQGLNLGLKDAAALAEVVVEARRFGEDIGSEAVLGRYARWRRLDRLAFAAATDAFVRGFSTEAPLARLARGAAFALAGAAAPLRRLAMHEAGGRLGEPPRLMAGLPL